VIKIEQLRTTDRYKRKSHLSERQFPVESVADRSPQFTKFNHQKAKIEPDKRIKHGEEIKNSSRFWPTSKKRCDSFKTIIDHFFTGGQNRPHRALENA
jgi:hypothetical protein